MEPVRAWLVLGTAELAGGATVRGGRVVVGISSVSLINSSRSPPTLIRNRASSYAEPLHLLIDALLRKTFRPRREVLAFDHGLDYSIASKQTPSPAAER